IEPKFAIVRKQNWQRTVHTIRPDDGDNAVRVLSDRIAGLGLRAAGRRVARAPVGTVTRVREVNARHEALELAAAPPRLCPLTHHLGKRADVEAIAGRLRLRKLAAETSIVKIVDRRAVAQSRVEAGLAKALKGRDRDDLVFVELNQ